MSRIAHRIDREIAINAEVERCASIMRAVGLFVESFRGDRDGFVVELSSGKWTSYGSIRNGMTVCGRKRVTRGFGLSVCEAFSRAAEEHRQ